MFFREELVQDTKWLEMALRMSWAAVCFGNPFLWETVGQVKTEEDKRHSCLWWRVAENGNGTATAKNLSALQTCSVCRLTVTLKLLNTDQWSWTYLLHCEVQTVYQAADPHCALHTASWGPGWVCSPIYTHRIQAEISRYALNVTVMVTVKPTATCSFTLMSNPQKATLSGTKETHLWGDTLCVMELTVQQAARGKPQTWASSPLLLRGSSSQSSLAGPHTSLSPTVGCYSGWWSGLPFHWPGSLPLQDESMLEWPPSPQTKTWLHPV